jgi:hypothetical protein
MYMHVLMCMHNQFGDVKKGGRKINEENEKERLGRNRRRDK